MAVTLGFTFEDVASKLCFRENLQLKLRFGGWECPERVEIIPNVWCGAHFAEDMKLSHRHFSWQAHHCVHVGCIEVELSLQAQGIARLRFGKGECRCDIGIGVSVGVVLKGWDGQTAWQSCKVCLL